MSIPLIDRATLIIATAAAAAAASLLIKAFTQTPMTNPAPVCRISVPYVRCVVVCTFTYFRPFLLPDRTE